MWRPGYLACLMEKHLPVWVITPVGFAAGSEPAHLTLVSHGQSGRPAVADLVVLMAGLFGGSDRLRAMADAEGLLHQVGSQWWVAPAAELPEFDDEVDEPAGGELVIASSGIFEEALDVVRDRCRVTVMAFPDSLVSDEGTVAWLRSGGVDVDEFTLKPAGSEPT